MNHSVSDDTGNSRNKFLLKEKAYLRNLYQTHVNLGKLKLNYNKYNSALFHFFNALKIFKVSKSLYILTFNLFCKNRIDSNNFYLMRQICIFFLKSDFVYHQYAFANAIRFTKIKELKNIKFKRCFLTKKNLEYLNDNIFHLILKKCLIHDLNVELFLTKIREEILLKFFNNKNFLKNINNFIISLAEQLFFNEHIFSTKKSELSLVNKIEQKVLKKKKICELSILVISLYKPLFSLNSIHNKLGQYKSKSIEFNNFLKFVYIDSKVENRLKDRIQTPSKIKNKISKSIKTQYEENPYPRWRYTSVVEEKEFKYFLSKMKGNKSNNKVSKPKILIAGCGTGHQVVQYAGIKNSKIDAIDLSQRSLSYAYRKTIELNIQNVNFFNMDILDVGILKKKYDLIICSGCLHHMDKPSVGLKSLINVTKKNGLIYIGLYSTLARKSILQIRNYIKEKKMSANKENFFKLRNRIISSNYEDYKKISRSIDFFSLSRFRDLVFNFKEHTFNLNQIKKMIIKNKLEFLGFDRLNNNTISSFRNMFPDENSELNINFWNKFESVYPDTFSSMYNFWLMRK